MREILFRAQRVVDKGWVEGFLLQGINKDVMLIQYWSNEKGYCLEDVITKTIGQFTGLTDKNGVKIFEGDILKSTFEYNGNKQEILGVVEHDMCNPCFVIHYKYNGSGHDCYEYDFIQCGLRKNEIIGNIHDNQELLK